MTDQEWVAWLEDIKFNLDYIPVRIRDKQTGEVSNDMLSTLSMKEGMGFLILWARGKVRKESKKE